MKFASIEDVKARLEEEPTPAMIRMIEAGLEDASDMAIFYGASWGEMSCPDPVRRIVARAVARWIRNPDGFEQSRAADETLVWAEPTRDVEFTPEEIARIRALGRPVVPKYAAAPISPYGSREPGEGGAVYVPTSSGSPYPFLVGNRGGVR